MKPQNLVRHVRAYTRLTETERAQALTIAAEQNCSLSAFIQNVLKKELKKYEQRKAKDRKNAASRG